MAALAGLAEEIFADRLDPNSAGLAAGFDPELWAVLEEAGLTLLSVPEAAGGTGGGLAASAVVLAAAARHAAPVPLAETDLLAGWLLSEAGLAVPPGPLTAVVASTAPPAAPGEPAAAGVPAPAAPSAAASQLSARGQAGPPRPLAAADGGLSVRNGPGGPRVSGRLERAPWGRAAGAVAVLVTGGEAGEKVLLVPAAAAAVERGVNVAREPRDTLRLDGAAAIVAAPAPAGAGAEFQLRGALARSVQISAAAARAVDWAVRHAGEREQFGRPIGRFQAVQQELAEAAAESAAASAAVEAAVRIASRDGFGTPAARIAVAVAKAQASAAAGLVAQTAHQVHGAIGFTLEHPLRTLTTRLWAWRGEFGDETRWNRVVGQAALESGERVWHSLTGWS